MNPAASRLQSRSRLASASLVISLLAAIQSVCAQNLYWDINGNTANTGASAAGNWDGSTVNWNSDPTGGAAGSTTAITASTDNIYFSSGTGHSGTFTVSASGTRAANALNFEEGAVTLTGGTISLGTARTISVSSGVTATVNSLLSGTNGLAKTGTGTLMLGTGNATPNAGLTGTISILEGRLVAGSQTSGTANATNGQLISIGDTAGSAGATFSINRNHNYNSAVTINAGSSGIKRISGGPGLAISQTPTIMGAITLNDNVTLGNGDGGNVGGVNLSGVITGNKTITIDGATAYTNASTPGTIAIIRGASDTAFTGDVAVERGVLRIGSVGAIGTGTALVSTAVGSAFDMANGGTSGSSISIEGLANGTTTGGVVTNNATGTGTVTLTLAGATQNSYGGAIIDGATSKVALTVSLAGAGTQTFTGANTYSGTTTVTSGTLALGANNSFSSASAYVLNGGALSAGTFSATLGTLDLNANSSITLGSGGKFAFADSHLQDWGSFSLSVGGSFTSGSSLRFGSSNAGLTSAQLNLISIAGFTNIGLDTNGFLTASAVPEPSSLAALAGLVGMGFAASRRRRQTRGIGRVKTS